MTDDPLDEILFLAGEIDPELDQQLLKEVHEAVTSIFSGNYPGYRASKPQYHDIRHTHGVALATIRLFHGLRHDGHKLSARTIQKGLLSAYFHDTGLVLRTTDTAESGANYTKFHEDRSIQCLHKYLIESGRAKVFCHDCANIIRFTNINLAPSSIPELSESVRCAGNVVGTADLLAQMADRYYLESLPLLFEEHKAGGISDNKTASELIKKTGAFYQQVIRERLNTTFNNVRKSMKTHFRERFQIENDLYMENINNNIEYLDKILREGNGDINKLQEQLRRKAPRFEG